MIVRGLIAANAINGIISPFTRRVLPHDVSANDPSMPVKLVIL
jgi:hypothetical protein